MYVYELLVGPGVSATDQARQLAITQGKSCPNCLDYKSRKYPLHKENQCPYTTPTGLPRSATPAHHPVAQADGHLSYASEGGLVAAALHERQLFLAALVTASKVGKGGGKGAGSPPPAVRERTFQPMRIAPPIPEDPEELPDGEVLEVPEEIPQPAVRMKQSAWASSARGAQSWALQRSDESSSTRLEDRGRCIPSES